MSPGARVRLVLFEAATCCSLPVWMLAGDRAWPANGPLAFAVTVLAGATIAFLAFHIAPALLVARTGWRDGRWRRWSVVAAAALYGVGAAVAFVRLADTGGRAVLWTPGASASTFVASVGLAAGVLLVSMLARPRLRLFAAVLLVAFPLVLLSATVVAQWDGLSGVTPRMVSEQDLDDNMDVLKGLLLAAAPASVYGIVIGRGRPSVRAVLATGATGMWLPLVVTAALVAVAKVTGVRLYWRPSVPIGAEWAFQWFVQHLLRDARVPVVVLTIAPLCATALGLKEAFECMRRHPGGRFS